VTAHGRLFLSLEDLFIHTGGRNERHGGGGGRTGGGNKRQRQQQTAPALLMICVVRQNKAADRDRLLAESLLPLPRSNRILMIVRVSDDPTRGIFSLPPR
jgi:hypothetical protein